jgi:type IV fimbrial biogenesis protein FimT
MKKRSVGGFTIIEIMIVIAIIGIMVGIAAPNFMDYLKSRRLSGAATQLYVDLMNARQQAVTENKKIVVEFVNNNQYQFVRDNDKSETVTTGDQTLFLRDIHPEYSDITFSASFNPAFRPDGTGKNPKITLTSSSTGKTKCIYISTAGRIRIGDCS